MARVVWSPQARDDLRRIVVFIGEDSPTIASEVGHRIVSATRHLADFPRSGRVVPEFRMTGIREVVIGSHRVIYEVSGNRVEVLTVAHGARRLRRSMVRKP